MSKLKESAISNKLSLILRKIRIDIHQKENNAIIEK